MTATLGEVTDQAALIRQHAWTQPMRKTYAECPGFYSKCACQSGAKPLTSYETVICWRGDRPAYFLEEFSHPTEDATGWKHTSLAMVWLADRVCRWVCPCVCHSTPPPSAAPAAPEQQLLFDLELTP